MKSLRTLGWLVFLWAGLALGTEQKVPAFPAFVYGHIVWEDESTSSSLRALIKDYQDHQIPISGVIIDSPWETAYDNFEFDTKRFPDYPKLISEIKGQNLAVILWIVSAVNTDDPDYKYALSHGYFAKGLEKFKWWKGTGGLIDFKNPEALKWWHKRMDKALDLGIDGWKCDGVDGMIALKSMKERNEYAREYYSDFFNYSREHTGKPIVIMARGIEKFNEHQLGLPHWLNPLNLGIDLTYAPVETSFMSWMGDQDMSWDGIRDAFLHFNLSAKAGYLNPGFDIGGYRGGKESKELFIRWAQWGAFVPFMENGGVSEHRPWKYGDDATDIYRKLATWHEELGWYFYSLAPERFRTRKSLIEMTGKSYLLGDEIFIAPILKKDGKLDAKLPDGNWKYWYNLTKGFQGGAALAQDYSLAEFPVYLKEGSLVPLWVKYPYGGHKLNASFTSQDTFWLLPGAGQGSRAIIYPDGGEGKVTWKRNAGGIEVSAEGVKREVMLLVEGAAGEPRKISKSINEQEKSTVGKVVSYIKSLVTGGKEIGKEDCEKIKPDGEAEYCLKGTQLFMEMIPQGGKAEVKITF